jgi:glycosyltransferase involved in cell wall biosynthesis
MKCPDYFISKCRFPFLKKRSFCPEHYHEDNLRKAMTLIRSKGYELHLIIDNVSRKYELSDEIKAMAKSDEMDAQYLQYETGEYSVDKASKTPEQIIAFIQKNNNKDMYVYGAGAFGSRVYLVYRKYMKNFKGFVVSKKTMDSVLGEKMYGIDEIPLDRSAIIIGMDKKNTETVLRENLAGAENVLNLYEQKTDKKLSIITVVYNNVKEIEQTIQSVINQNLPPQNLEYIILDGGSTDGTCDIIKKYEASLSYWKSEPDNGIYDAMNKGIDIATGDIIAFLNSGDWYEANVLADILKFFSENETDIVYGKVNRIVNEEICGFMCNSTRDGDYERLHIKNLFCHQGMFMKKTLFQDYGKFDLQYKVLADYDWNLRVYNKGAKIKVIPEVVANYRTGGCSEKADTHEEYGKIAYRNLNGREDLLPEIDKNIKTSEEYYKLKKVLEETVNLSVPVINNNKHYYIWGLGGDAKLSFAILDKLDIKASGIIDRAAKVPEYNGIRVYPSCSAEIPKLLSDAESCVFISSTDYEDEIRKELDTLGIAEDKVISLREVWKYLIRLED